MAGAAAPLPGTRGRKALALSLLCLLLLSQPPAAAAAPQPAQAPPQPPSRQRRMTPFWRGLPLRPVGASCRHNSECITALCRKNRCFLRTATA